MKRGNCTSCHVLPDFTDFRVHETGVSQEEFDAAKRDGAFPVLTDLGLWNSVTCAVDQGLVAIVAKFKTPMLRDLEDSAPYFHNGSKPKLDEIVNCYVKSVHLVRQGKLRNGAVKFAGMTISADDLDALVAFLKALTED